jgi:biotin synthase
MPNLSPGGVRKDYELYDDKLFTGAESAQDMERLDRLMRGIGCHVVVDRGDPKPLP